MSAIAQFFSNIAHTVVANSHFNLNSDLGHLFVMIVLVVAISGMVNFLLANSVFGPSYRAFVAPGIVVHEFSHAIICFLTGAKITKISLFDKQGGSVTHQPSKLPIIGPLLISFAPFFFGTALIILFAHWLGIKTAEMTTFQFSFASISSYIVTLFHRINFADWHNIFILYLALSVAVTMTPSRQDILNVAILLIFITAISFYLFQVRHLSLNLAFLPIEKITILVSTVIILLILALVLSIVIFAVSKIFKK